MKTDHLPSLIALFTGLLWSLLAGVVHAAAPPLPLRGGAEPVGEYASYLYEAEGRLSLEQVVSAADQGLFSAGRSPVLSFGIGSRPVWIHFRVENPEGGPLPQRLSVETAWLDDLEVYFLHEGKAVVAYRTGDRELFGQRPSDDRFFVFGHIFEPGESDIFLRVQTDDPMVLPVYLLSPDQVRQRVTVQDYSYGFLYGFLFALLAYNLMLYGGLRDSRYLLYSLYLGMFLLMNISYTGHGYRWIWPESPVWAQWSNPVLMVLYASAGLFFARRFLQTRKLFPRLDKVVLGYVTGGAGLLALAIVFGSQRNALLIAFTFVFVFTGIMLFMGVMGVRKGQTAARYFLLAAISAMLGAASTALAVWGFIPFNVWTYRAVDIGMLLDATLLALALTYQFRLGKVERDRAERLARLDPLTGINNRRAFYDIAVPIWSISLRNRRSLSVILMDIDRFKRINDVHGHARGDEVLIATAGVLKAHVREQDVIARWGGEEFILLLPETNIEQAAALAERLRIAIEEIRLDDEGVEIGMTASFGVTQRQMHHQSLDALISHADDLLYQSKELGRNRVSYVELSSAI